MTEYRKGLDEIILWLTKAENAVQKRSATELAENLQELTVSGLPLNLPMLFAAYTCTRNVILHD